MLSLCLALCSALSHAEESDPASRVARISYLKGHVYMQTADDSTWNNASINQPLTSGDQLWTGGQARSELQMGRTTLQVDADTQLRLLELSDEALQVQVTQGVVNLRVRHLDKHEIVEIDTPNAAVSVLEPGTYRIEVADRDELTVVQVRDGSAEVAGEKQSFSLRTDEQLSLHGSERLSAEFDDLARMDEFDRWSAERNRRAERVASARYVSPDMIGYEDLDDYGYWRWYNDYGYVWMPTRIVAGWAPYRYGRWGWVSPWGWTWIDDAPWGFAPFHYGRWASLHGHWCWVPGPRIARPVYAPALVAWIGTPGISVSVNVGTRPVGWIPLGPREIYRPVYRSSRDYLVNVNLSNSLLNRDEFERGYRRRPHEEQYGNRHAASVVQADTLREAQPVNRHLIGFDAGRLQSMDQMPVSRPDLVPETRDSRNITPPVLPNSREVLARRRPVWPSQGNADVTPVLTAPRNMDGVRVIDPNTIRRSGSYRNGERTPAESQVMPRSDGNQINARRPDGTRSITTSPYMRPDTNKPRDNPSRGQPAEAGRDAGMPVPAPKVTGPRIRSNPWVRDEARPDGRERSGQDTAQPSIERQRSIPAPSNPMPAPRREPAPFSPDAAPSGGNPDSNRAPTRGDDAGFRHRRFDRDTR